jgi:dTDP-4-dehydrorhamnose 3,5-epimerase-like enzyme
MKLPIPDGENIATTINRELKRRGWHTQANEHYRLSHVHGTIDIHAQRPRHGSDIFINIDREYKTSGGVEQLAKADKLYHAAKANQDRRSFYFNAQQTYENGQRYVDLQWKPRETLYHE